MEDLILPGGIFLSSKEEMIADWKEWHYVEQKKYDFSTSPIWMTTGQLPLPKGRSL